MLRNAVTRAVPEADVVAVDDEHTLGQHESPHCVWLVNRVLDGGFSIDSGIELIRRTTGRNGNDPRCLLISNHRDAQEQAVAAGARPGFGKSELFDERTLELLRQTVA